MLSNSNNWEHVILSFKNDAELKKLGGVSKSMLTLNEAIIDVKKG